MHNTDRSRTYLISSSLIDLYYTQIIGDPTNPPIIKASGSFSKESFSLIDANPYLSTGTLAWNSTNVFFRQIRNLVLDTTALAPDFPAVGIHWPSSQATSITNCVFRLSTIPGNRHTGLLIEEGSGGLLNDLYFYGGGNATVLGNQQFTARNLWFSNADVAIWMTWDWGWTFKSAVFKNCRVGIKMDDSSNSVGSITILDSWFENMNIAIATTRNSSQALSGVSSLAMENVKFQNVNNILIGPEGVDLARSNLDPSGSGVFVMASPLSWRQKLTNSNRGIMPTRTAHLLQLRVTLFLSPGVKPSLIAIFITNDRSLITNNFQVTPSYLQRLTGLMEMHPMMIPKRSTHCSSTRQRMASSLILMLDTTWSPTLFISLQTPRLWARL